MCFEELNIVGGNVFLYIVMEAGGNVEDFQEVARKQEGMLTFKRWQGRQQPEVQIRLEKLHAPGVSSPASNSRQP